MERTPEPELMLDPAQAAAYAAADFGEPHDRFVSLLRERLPGLPAQGVAADLGCGPGDVTLRFARDFPGWSVDAVDGSPPMLALARDAARAAGLDTPLRFFELSLPAALPGSRYDLLFSNSLLHHLRDPGALFEPVRRHLAAGSAVFVMDLLRPDDPEAVHALVARYAAGEAEILRRDFHHSLHAAYRPDEIRAQLARAGLDALTFETVSDRHWIVWGGSRRWR